MSASEHLLPADDLSHAVLERRADALAAHPAEEVVADIVSTLRFRLGQEWYAVHLADVREILHDYTVTQMPCVPPHIRGVVSIRGEILSVTDPAQMMGLGAVQSGGISETPAVVVERGDVATALVVDELGDITEIAAEDIEPPISTIDQQQAEFITGTIHDGGVLIGLVNADRILAPVITGTRYERQ